MLGGEDGSLILRGELLPVVEDHLERRIMWLEKNVWRDDLVFQFRVDAGMMRILCASHVEPGPAVESVLFDMSDVVGDEVVAESVTFVDGDPELSGIRVDGDADCVANAGGVDAFILSLGREGENVGAVEFGFCIVVFIDIRMRADANEHDLAVVREGDVARPVAATAEMSAAGKIGDVFRRAASFQVSADIREANHGIRVADVNVLGIVRGIKSDAEGLAETRGESGNLLRATVGIESAKDLDLSSLTVGEKDIAVGCGTDETRIFEAVSVKRDFESVGRLRQGSGRTGDDVGSVVDGFGSEGLGEIADGDLVCESGTLLLNAGENRGGELGRSGGGIAIAEENESEQRQDRECAESFLH